MRAGQARLTAIGVRMSGLAICASIDPSRKATRACTIDCGWTTTSSCAGVTGNRQWASISSKPLFINVAESMVILRPIVQLG